MKRAEPLQEMGQYEKGKQGLNSEKKIAVI